MSDAEPAWSAEIRQASWIGERLAPSGAYVVTSVVPGGLEAYARVLHPAEEPLHGGDRVVRWAEVTAWSGLPCGPARSSTRSRCRGYGRKARHPGPARDHTRAASTRLTR